jgi:hypothetical protein
MVVCLLEVVMVTVWIGWKIVDTITLATEPRGSSLSAFLSCC